MLKSAPGGRSMMNLVESLWSAIVDRGEAFMVIFDMVHQTLSPNR
jgi:hypothetical protein